MRNALDDSPVQELLANGCTRDRMIEALDREGPARSRPAVAAALEDIAALLGDDTGGPGTFLPIGRNVAAQVTGRGIAAARCRRHSGRSRATG